ncbi:MAG: nucleotide exchange factor GrpE [Bacillota bacterium]
MFSGFWGKKGKIEEIAGGLDHMGKQLTCIGEQVARIAGQLAGVGEQSAEIGSQVNKLARIQYKTGQEIMGKLDRLAAGMDLVQRWQSDHDAGASRLNVMEHQIEYLTGVIIGQLDDIDFVCAGLQGEGRENWRKLLRPWGDRLLAALAEVGVYEVDVIGRTFDPQLAESIGAVARDSSAGGGETSGPRVPYEVVEVVKRGFVLSDGRLLRKAQVITVREDCTDE